MRLTKYLRSLARRLYRARRSLVIGAAVTIAIVVGGLYYMSRPHRIAGVARALLEQLTGADAQIASASFNFLDGWIVLDDVRLRVPGIDDKGGDLFQAERLLFRVDPIAVLRGQFTASRMVLVRPVLWLTDVGGNVFNYERLREVKTEASTGPTPSLPRVDVREASVRYGEMHRGTYQSTGELGLLGQLTPDFTHRGIYHFKLYQVTDRPTLTAAPETGPVEVHKRPSLIGQFDMQRLEVRANLKDFAFADPHRTMLPRRIRRWWDLFEPSGSLPDIQLDWDPQTGPKGRLHVEDVALTLTKFLLPELSEADYRGRMTDVNGDFHFDAEQIRIEGLEGQIEGLHYRIDGTIDGYTEHAAFRLQLRTSPFRIPEQPRYVAALPRSVQELFRQFKPVGWMQATLSLQRRLPRGPVEYQGTARILSGRDARRELELAGITDLPDPGSPDLVSSGQYYRFPYPLTHVHGLLTYDSESVEVKNLTGRTPGGGTATVTGRLAAPGVDGAIDVTVTAVNIPFDQSLFAALAENRRRAVEQFFDGAAWKQLHEAGHFITSIERGVLEDRRTTLLGELRAAGADAAKIREVQEQLDQIAQRLARPDFDLGGRGNAVVSFRKRDGDSTGQLHTALEMTGTNVLYKHFPYPFHVDGGRVEIDGEKVRFESVRGRGINGGTGELSGSIDLPSTAGEGPLRPLVVLAARNMPLDDLLPGVLSGSHADLVADLHLAGEFDADTLIQLDDAGELDVHTELGFADASVTPGGGRFTVSGLTGKLTVARGRLRLPKVVGARGGTRIELEAEADWTKPKRPWLAVRARADGLDFQDPIIDLVGARDEEAGETLKHFWQTYKPAGRFDAEVAYRLEGDSERDYLLTLRPTDLAFDYGGARVKLTETTGLVRISPERVEIDRMSGRFPAGRAVVWGEVKLGAEVVSTLRIEAEADELNATARCFLPPNVLSVIDGLKIRGAYSLQIPRFVHRPGAREGVETDFSGVVQVRGAAFELGVDVREFDGSIRLSSSTRAGQSDAAVDIEVDARRLQVAGRPIEDFHARIQDRGPESDLIVRSLRGRYAQGRIVGKGSVDQDSGDYQLQLALTGADLGQMLRDQPAKEPGPRPKKDPMPGALAASLSVQGNWRDAKRLRGRGELRVRHGDLTGLPLAFGLLQISHLNMPVSHRFHNAGVSYYLQDGRVVFEHLELNSRSLQLAGSGTMGYPGGELNLALTTVNPRGMDLGALTDLINGVRNQLVTIRVTGTVDKPVTSVESFNALTGALDGRRDERDLILPRR